MQRLTANADRNSFDVRPDVGRFSFANECVLSSDKIARSSLVFSIMNFPRRLDMPSCRATGELASCAVKLGVGSFHVRIKVVEQDNGLFQSVPSVGSIRPS